MVTDVNNFDVNKVCFMDHEDATMKGGSVSFKSVPIRMLRKNGSKKNPSFSSRTSAFRGGFKLEVEKCKQHCLSNRAKLGSYDL